MSRGWLLCDLLIGMYQKHTVWGRNVISSSWSVNGCRFFELRQKPKRIFSRPQSKAPQCSSTETRTSLLKPSARWTERESGREMETIRNVQMYGWLAERMDPVWKSRSAASPSAGHTGAGRRPECVCVWKLQSVYFFWLSDSDGRSIQRHYLRKSTNTTFKNIQI